jgi:hypothetical protein
VLKKIHTQSVGGEDHLRNEFISAAQVTSARVGHWPCVVRICCHLRRSNRIAEARFLVGIMLWHVRLNRPGSNCCNPVKRPLI